jgi:hypothetical protein
MLLKFDSLGDYGCFSCFLACTSIQFYAYYYLDINTGGLPELLVFF